MISDVCMLFVRCCGTCLTFDFYWEQEPTQEPTHFRSTNAWFSSGIKWTYSGSGNDWRRTWSPVSWPPASTTRSTSSLHLTAWHCRTLCVWMRQNIDFWRAEEKTSAIVSWTLESGVRWQDAVVVLWSSCHINIICSLHDIYEPLSANTRWRFITARYSSSCLSAGAAAGFTPASIKKLTSFRLRS